MLARARRYAYHFFFNRMIPLPFIEPKAGYPIYRLKLERAIQYKRTRQALIETQKLLDLVKHLNHPYTTWLRNMERHLLLKTESRK